MYDQKIQSASKIVETHNSTVPDNLKINWDSFLEKLQTIGGTTEETLRQCSWEDLESCGLPRLVARQVSQIFRKHNDGNNKKASYVSAGKAAYMTIKELMERYDPKNSDNVVGGRLKKISGGMRCVVFNNDGTVNVDISTKLLEDIQAGYEELSRITIGDRPVPTYKIGETVGNFVDENPLYPGRPLRRGVCDQTNRSWEGVSGVVRRILYIALKGELRNSSGIEDAHRIIDLAISESAESKVRARYPEASIQYDELEKIGQLPLLKVELKRNLNNSSSNENNDPFYGDHKNF